MIGIVYHYHADPPKSWKLLLVRDLGVLRLSLKPLFIHKVCVCSQTCSHGGSFPPCLTVAPQIQWGQGHNLDGSESIVVSLQQQPKAVTRTVINSQASLSCEVRSVSIAGSKTSLFPIFHVPNVTTYLTKHNYATSLILN